MIETNNTLVNNHNTCLWSYFSGLKVIGPPFEMYKFKSVTLSATGTKKITFTPSLIIRKTSRKTFVKLDVIMENFKYTTYAIITTFC